VSVRIARRACLGRIRHCGARRLEVARLEVDPGGEQRTHRPVGGAAVLLDQRAGRRLDLVDITGLRGHLELVVDDRGGRGFTGLVPAPGAPARDREQHHRDHGEQKVAVAVPERLEGGELFLFFQVVGHGPLVLS
jgi:hypothetical protein